MDRNIQTSDELSVVVRDRNNLLFQGKIDAVSSINDKGPFDILPQHANFISLITQAVVLHISGKQEKRIDLQSGVLKVRDNNVEIYVGILR
ncbi:MAG: hypothetical protein U1A25_02535 [Candidatus Sungbacteria bacterium]|nr:hypothetical protein [bacterium]MDZ4260518.1 hypothetical protein [Candidatus Sungbacteria bacterium]